MFQCILSITGTILHFAQKPDIVHVFADGHFVKTGGPELADELEENGYDQYLPEGADSESALA